MIIYESTISQFVKDCDSKAIADIVADELKKKTGRAPAPAEKNAFAASLPKMAEALGKSAISTDAGVGIEYRPRFGGDRIDFLIYGLDKMGQRNVVVVELKQWSDVFTSGKPNHVFANTHGGVKEDHCHPSIQAANYLNILRNFNAYIQDNDIGLHACSYAHNMPSKNLILVDEKRYPVVLTSPAFLRDDVAKLVSFLEKFVSKASLKEDILYEIDHSEIKPSIHLSETLAKALNGEPYFSCDKYQENAVSEILFQVKDALEYNERRVIIVKGAPGTGKSVVAMNALGQLIHPKKGKGYNACYVVVNSAIKTLFLKKLINGNYKKGFLKELFKYPTALKNAPGCSYDCGIFDESHRLMDNKPGVGLKKGYHLFKDLMNACRVSVFFVDGDQRVTAYDYGVEDNIRKVAKELKIRVIAGPELELLGQYRCLGGDEYIDFVHTALGYKSGRTTFDIGQYDFEVVDSPKELFDWIHQKDKEFQAINVKARNVLVPSEVSGECRVVAGYTHNWVSKKQLRSSAIYDFEYPDGTKKKWNLRNSEVGADYSWLDDPSSVDEIGCIHTCQGLDLNYCGVIIGKDLTYKNGQLHFDKKKNAKTDTASKIRLSPDDLAKTLIRNTYNVLLTRGMKGTHVYCEDPQLAKYLRSFKLRHE